MPLRHWSHTDPVSVRGPQARHRKVLRSRICALRAGSVPSGCAIARRLPTESPARTQPTATETDPMTEGTADRHQHTPAPGRTRAQAYNDSAAAAHAKHPDRFVGLAMLPMQAPELALEELERAAKLPGLRGMYLATHVNNTELDDRRFWNIYAKAEELGWPVFLHPIDTIGRERTTRYYLKNLLGNPYDTGVAAALLIFGGVLDAFPKLEVNLPHAGGTFPWLIGRLDHGTKVRPELKHMKQLPSAYLRRFTYDTIGHNDRINTNLIRLVGADRVVLGSDYCFDMGLADPLGDVERLDALTAAERDLIAGQTAIRLLRLE